jgi:hypothetical protein
LLRLAARNDIFIVVAVLQGLSPALAAEAQLPHYNPTRQNIKIGSTHKLI